MVSSVTVVLSAATVGRAALRAETVSAVVESSKSEWSGFIALFPCESQCPDAG
jgi:hypothetical protein